MEDASKLASDSMMYRALKETEKALDLKIIHLPKGLELQIRRAIGIADCHVHMPPIIDPKKRAAVIKNLEKASEARAEKRKADAEKV